MYNTCKFVLALCLTFSANAFAQEWALKKLESSPRHHEWVPVEHDQRKVDCFVAYPEVKDKATAVIVIHEIFGLSEWVRSLSDQLAEQGYIAIAPDLVSGMGKEGGGTPSYPNRDAIVKAVTSLPQDQITADLDAVYEYVSKLPACNGKVVVAGFCWGGGQSFRYATNNPKLSASLVFYGSGPTDAGPISKITAPVFGFYAENDNRVNATVEKSEQLMKDAGKKFEAVYYKGAGHGFMRAGDDPEGNEGNKQGRAEGWKRVKEILSKL